MKLRLISVLAVVVLAGCSKIHEQRSFTLDPQATNTLSVTAPISEQKVTVAVTSDQPISVYVLLEKDEPKVDKGELEPEKMKEGVLAKEVLTKSATLEVTIPAKQAFDIFIINRNNVKANVTVKVDSH
jgi:hypothetical protein